MDSQIGTSEEKTKKISLGDKIVKIFFTPTKVFENIRIYPDWLFPFLLMVLVTIIFALSTRAYLVDFQKEAIYNNSFIPDQYKDKAVEKLENRSVQSQNIQNVVGGTIQVTLNYLLIAGVLFLVGNFVLGGKASYKQIFSLYSWAGMISVLEILIKLPLALIKGSLPIYTSLAIFMDFSKARTPLFIFLNAFDLFTIWRIILWGLGLQIIYRFSQTKAMSTVFVLYGLYVSITIAIAMIF